MHRRPYDELDNALAKLDAFTRLISHFQDMPAEDRGQYAEGEGFLLEAMMAESARARQSFNQCWRMSRPANDRRVG